MSILENYYAAHSKPVLNTWLSTLDEKLCHYREYESL
ncbi:hypothetical protein E9230_000495 [Corynebacterium glutamicum]|nr:hypothetical protein [Corynebacterium glutamicum]